MPRRVWLPILLTLLFIAAGGFVVVLVLGRPVWSLWLLGLAVLLLLVLVLLPGRRGPDR